MKHSPALKGLRFPVHLFLSKSSIYSVLISQKNRCPFSPKHIMIKTFCQREINVKYCNINIFKGG